jgi:predicted nucleotidyltransferase
MTQTGDTSTAERSGPRRESVARLVEEHREKILELAARHGASNVRVFGSFARGEGTESSDLDLLVTLEEKRSLLDLVGLKQDIEDLLHRSVDVVTEPALSPYIRKQVLAEATPL